MKPHSSSVFLKPKTQYLIPSFSRHAKKRSCCILNFSLCPDGPNPPGLGRTRSLEGILRGGSQRARSRGWLSFWKQLLFLLLCFYHLHSTAQCMYDGCSRLWRGNWRPWKRNGFTVCLRRSYSREPEAGRDISLLFYYTNFYRKSDTSGREIFLWTVLPQKRWVYKC